MAKNQNIRIRPSALQSDLAAHAALQAIENYVPANPAYAKDVVQEKLQAMQAAQQDELHAQNALAAARDRAAAAEWDFHNTMLGVKDQVIAQFGKDSDEIQALGLKKRSERKAPRPKARAQ